MDEIYLYLEDCLDAVFDFCYHEYATKQWIKNEFEKAEKYFKEHFARFKGRKIKLIKFLDNHDLDRQLFLCKNNKEIFLKSMNMLFNEKYDCEEAMVMQYGTEDMMTQEFTINDESYGDSRCRCPMEFKFEKMCELFFTRNFFNFKA